MTRIAMLTSAHYPPVEGMGFYTHRLARHLVANGHTVTLITRGGLGRPRPWECDGIPVVQLPFAPLYPFHVHAHGIFVRRFLREHRNEFDVVHAHTPLVPVPSNRLPLVVTIHSPMKTDTEAVAITGLRSATIRAQGLVSQRLERSLFKYADELLAVASSVAMDLSAYGIDPGKVVVAGNAVDPGEFSPEPSIVPIPVVMYCGRLSEEKGLADLVRAIALLAPNHPGLTLRLVGTGPSERDLRRLALRLKIDGRVEFAGHIPSERRGELVRMYRQAAVYVQPSHHEGMPTSLLEAMACGRPTVATAVSGHPDAIEDGTTGLLVRPRDPPSLAGAIARVLSDPFLAERLGRGARAKVLTDHTWKAVTSVYEAAFDRARANWAHRTRNVSPVQ